MRERLGKDITVKMLTLDPGVPVCAECPWRRTFHITEEVPCQDITRCIIRNRPEHQYTVGEGAGGGISRAIYRRINPTTRQMEDINVSHHSGPMYFTDQIAQVVIKSLRGTRDQYAKIEKVNIHTYGFARRLNDRRQKLNREISTWRGLRHPNICELLGVAKFNSDLPPGLVSRWVQRNNFLQYIGRHPDFSFKRRKV